MPTQILQSLLHESIALSLKTQNFHWNVEGPNFGPLHKLFGKQYEDLQEAIDLIAERIRALDEYAHPHNSNEGCQAVDPIPSKPPKATKMIEILGVENEKLGYFCEKMAAKVAPEDPATSNLLADRQMAHQKAAWMLRSHLK